MINFDSKIISSSYLDDEEVGRIYIGDNLLLKQKGPANLPDEYTEVEYIIGNGGLIDTGVIPTRSTIVETQVGLVEGARGFFYPCASTKTNNSFMLEVNVFSSSAKVTATVGGQYNVGTVTNLPNDYSTKYKITFSSSRITVNGVSSGISSASSFTTNVTLKLFGISASNVSSFKMWYCKIYNGTTLLRDLIPCTNSSNQNGFYDKVNNVFYTHPAFLAGPVQYGVIVKLKLDPSQSGWGEVIGGGRYYESTPVIVKARPTQGHKFKNWYVVSRLPDGYKEVEYIKSDTLCGINIDLPAIDFSQKKFHIVLDTYVHNYENGVESFFTSDAVTSLFFMRRTSENSLQFGIGNTSTFTETIDITGQRILIDYNSSGTILKVGETTYTVGGATGSTQNIQLFASESGGYSAVMNLYNCIVYEGATEIRNLIPCISPEGAVGLYDLVEERFFNNSREGNFTPGPQITKIPISEYMDYHFKVTNNIILFALFEEENIVGFEWEKTNLPTANPSKYNIWQGLTYGDGKFIVANYSKAEVDYSEDGINWTTYTLPYAKKGWCDGVYGDGKFILIPNDYSYGVYSTNGGKSWSSVYLASGEYNGSIAYGKINGGNRFVIVSSQSNYFKSSTNGTSWSSSSSSGASNYYSSATFCDGKFIYAPSSRHSSGYFYIDSTGLGSGTYVFPPSPKQYSYIASAYGNNIYIALAYNSDKYIYSFDGGVTLEEGTLPFSSKWQDITFGNGVFIAVSYSNKALYTENGLFWKETELPMEGAPRQECNNIIYGNGKFVATGITDNAMYATAILKNDNNN